MKKLACYNVSAMSSGGFRTTYFNFRNHVKRKKETQRNR